MQTGLHKSGCLQSRDYRAAASATGSRCQLSLEDDSVTALQRFILSASASLLTSGNHFIPSVIVGDYTRAHRSTSVYQVRVLYDIYVIPNDLKVKLTLKYVSLLSRSVVG